MSGLIVLRSSPLGIDPTRRRGQDPKSSVGPGDRSRVDLMSGVSMSLEVTRAASRGEEEMQEER